MQPSHKKRPISTIRDFTHSQLISIISKELKSAAKSLKEYEDIIVRKTDKSNCFLVMGQLARLFVPPYETKAHPPKKLKSMQNSINSYNSSGIS